MHLMIEFGRIFTNTQPFKTDEGRASRESLRDPDLCPPKLVGTEVLTWKSLEARGRPEPGVENGARSIMEMAHTSRGEQ